jgi:hypothetical protein
VYRTVAASVSGLFDYAGLFPPAALSLAEAAEEYRKWWDEPLTAAFVCPSDRLAQLSTCFGSDQALPVAVLLADPARAFEIPPGLQVVSLETKAASPAGMKALARLAARLADAGHEPAPFVEVLLGEGLSDTLTALAEADLGAKARLGGMTPAAFPTTDDVAAFIVEAVDLRLEVKLTAGLHHPATGEHPISAKDPSLGTPRMFGFLNCVLAFAAAESLEAPSSVVARILEASAEAMRWSEQAVEVCGETISAAALETAREALASIGSCSIHEPVADLTTMGLWP